MARMGQKKKLYRVLVETSERQRIFEDLGADGKIILEKRLNSVWTGADRINVT